jgi:hypothetical protein
MLEGMAEATEKQEPGAREMTFPAIRKGDR